MGDMREAGALCARQRLPRALTGYLTGSTLACDLLL